MFQPYTWKPTVPTQSTRSDIGKQCLATECRVSSPYPLNSRGRSHPIPPRRGDELIEIYKIFHATWV